MEIIVTHDSADFDAFAALVAARRLYPAATMVQGHGGTPDLRAFLALHRDRFPTSSPDAIDAREVTRVVLVDVRRAARLKTYGAIAARLASGDPALDVHVYDHHPASLDDVHGSLEVVAPVGSVTTLLVEEMARRGLAIDALEATLFALGIHADTGSLTFAGSTARDAAALAWLLDRGVTLPVLNRYLAPGLGPPQRELLRRAIGAATTRRIGGVDVGLLLLPLEHDVGGLDEVTSHLAALESHAALFAVYPSPRGRVQVIGRARAPSVDVGRVLKAIGGGGHASAGSAVVKDAPGDEVVRRIVAALAADPPRPARVVELMSSPVHTAGPTTTFRELRGALGLFRHTGLPIVDEGRVVGIVSRRDVEAAERDGDLDRPVASRMHRDVVTIAPRATLEDALSAMEAADVGRLPVVEGGRLLGIVTRTDVLRALYEGDGAPEEPLTPTAPLPDPA